jgi:hypothetical protein
MEKTTLPTEFKVIDGDTVTISESGCLVLSFRSDRKLPTIILDGKFTLELYEVLFKTFNT